MKKICLMGMIGIFFVPSFLSASYTVDEIILLIYGRRIEKRYKSLENFDQELQELGLNKLELECQAGKQESCFVLEKFMEKEVYDFVSAAKNLKQIQKEREDYMLMKGFPEFLDKYFPGISQDIKIYLMLEAQKRFDKREKREMKKLKKISCKSSDDVQGIASHLECRTNTLRKKYQRLQEKYPNKRWLFLLKSSEKNWSNTLRSKKRLCTHYGHAPSCIDLKKMKKK